MSYAPRSYESNFSNCVEKPEKFKTLTGFESLDRAMPVRRSNQLSYEAADVVASNVRVMNESMNEMICAMNDILNFGYEIK